MKVAGMYGYVSVIGIGTDKKTVGPTRDTGHGTRDTRHWTLAHPHPVLVLVPLPLLQMCRCADVQNLRQGGTGEF